MIIENNPLNFKSVKFTKSSLEVLSQRMPSGEFAHKIEQFQNKYANSPVRITFDTFDKFTPRLDATISYDNGKNKDLVHIMEGKLSYFFSLNPKKFLKKSAKEIEKMEKSYFAG